MLSALVLPILCDIKNAILLYSVMLTKFSSIWNKMFDEIRSLQQFEWYITTCFPKSLQESNHSQWLERSVLVPRQRMLFCQRKHEKRKKIFSLQGANISNKLKDEIPWIVSFYLCHAYCHVFVQLLYIFDCHLIDKSTLLLKMLSCVNITLLLLLLLSLHIGSLCCTWVWLILFNEHNGQIL